MKAEMIFANIKTLYTPYIKPPVKGKDMSKIFEYHDAFIAVSDGLIIGVGSESYDHFIDSKTEIYDARQMIAIPGLIDPHTHLVHMGSREDEYEQLKNGVPYLDILKNGGGILGTVKKTKEATFDQLYYQAMKSLNQMMKQGVTAIEAKSGYGLELETEIKQLKVIKALNRYHPIEISSTYMGAHAIPKIYQDQKEAFVSVILKDIETIKQLNLAESVDVFCEEGIFSIEDSRTILNHAKALGFRIRLHADEIHPLGGAGLAVELKATSADHLMAIKDEDIIKLAESQTIANLLPGTSFFLKKPFANARKMIDHGCAVSISTDYNPGSSPTEAFQFIMQLSSNYLNMKTEEVLNASTINPAYQIGKHEEMGSLEVGKYANFVLLDAPNLAYVLYHYGINHTKDVFIKGKCVVKNQEIGQNI
jgi:imidazolonepropionase